MAVLPRCGERQISRGPPPLPRDVRLARPNLYAATFDISPDSADTANELGVVVGNDADFDQQIFDGLYVVAYVGSRVTILQRNRDIAALRHSRFALRVDKHAGVNEPTIVLRGFDAALTGNVGEQVVSARRHELQHNLYRPGCDGSRYLDDVL